MLLGRAIECGRIDRLLERARGGQSGVLVVRGEAGIGKSALLAHAIAGAEDFVVLQSRGLEREAELAFSALSDLLRPLLGGLSGLPDPQRQALMGALALGPPVAGDRFAVAAGTLGLLAAASDDAPVLVVVDDAHWLDAASAEALAFTARRLGAERIVLLVGLRTGEPSLFDGSELAGLELGRLEPEPAEALLLRHTGAIAAPVIRELVGYADGNPLALTELPATLTAGQLTGVEPLPQPLPVGGGLEAAFRARLDALPARTRDALVVAAAAGERLDAILAALPLAGCSPDDLRPAEDAGVIAADGGRLGWRHPLLRSAAYASGQPSQVRDAHRALAAALGEPHAAERAWHLAAATVGTDEGVAGLLEHAALDARLRRGHAPAGEAFERAAALSPDREARARRLLEAGRDFQAAGWIERARTLLDEALAETEDRLLAADLAGQRGVVEMWGGDAREARRLLSSAAESVQTADPNRAAALLVAAGLAAQIAGRAGETLATARAAAALSGEVGPEQQLAIENLLFNALVLVGRTHEAELALPRLLAGLEQAPAPPADGLQAAATIGHSLVWIERDADARRYFERQIDAARKAGSPGFLPFLLACLSELDHRQGRWQAAEAGAVESVRLAEETHQLNLLMFSLVTLARVQAGRGAADDCRLSARRALELSEALGAGSIDVYAHAALGLLALGSGEPAAVHELEQVAQLMAAFEVAEPNVVPWRPDLIEAYVLAGRVEDAQRELTVLEQEAAGTGRRWARVAAARCRAMLAEGDDISHFEVALAEAEGASPFERARTELRLGERLRRLRRPKEAREPLQRGLATFDELGSASWAARARAELVATGLRVRRHDPAQLLDLTPQETRIAVLVGKGGTNREIAAELFLSPKTVGYHLAKVFDKLGVNSRAQLAGVVARGSLSRDEPV